jgi:transglutaminase-like putative cysteine protease
MPPRVVDRFFEFSLLGMLAAGYFAVVGSGYLDWPTATLTLAGLCLRALMVAGVVDLRLSGRVVAALTLAYIGFYPIDYYFISDSLLTATVHLLFFLAVLKILTAKTNRDYTYVKVIATLELLAAALLSASLSFFGYLALFVLFAIAALSSGEVRRSTQLRRSVVRSGLSAFPRRLGLLAVFLFHGILILTAGLFFILPRTARAALERFAPQRERVSGFSAEVNLGATGDIRTSSHPVMHAKPFPDGGFMEVRWRGAALALFDGRRWYNPIGGDRQLQMEHGSFTVQRRQRFRRGRTLSYEIHLGDMADGTLFFAGRPENISVNREQAVIFELPNGTYRVPASMASGLSYGAFSFLEDEYAPSTTPNIGLAPNVRDTLLQLPLGIDPRIKQLARAFSEGALSEVERAQAIEHHLRHEYGYSLQRPLVAVTDPLADFLFERKQGHCEFFASAMAVMLRTIGIPSRVVTGFHSGVYNPMTGWQVIRASDAHSWVEGWISGSGWTTFDPTPPDPGGSASALSSRVSLFFDAAEQFWQEWVVGYDQDRQFSLASRVEESGRRFRFRWLEGAFAWLKDSAKAGASYAPLVVVLVALALAAGLAGPSIARWWKGWLRTRRLSRGQGQASDATLLYVRMLEMLERRGVQKPPWITPNEFARGGVQRAGPPEIAAVVEDLTTAYNEFRFGGRSDVAPRMVQLLDRLGRL